MTDQVMSQLNVKEAAEICLKFRHDRNVNECICQFLAEAAEVEAAKHYPKVPMVLAPGYIPTNTRKKWEW